MHLDEGSCRTVIGGRSGYTCYSVMHFENGHVWILLHWKSNVMVILKDWSFLPSHYMVVWGDTVAGWLAMLENRPRQSTQIWTAACLSGKGSLLLISVKQQLHSQNSTQNADYNTAVYYWDTHTYPVHLSYLYVNVLPNHYEDPDRSLWGTW